MRGMTDRIDWSAKDRRREAREAVDIEARILPGGLPCRVSDLSGSGARLRLGQIAVLPAACILIEWSTGRAHQAEVVWRQGHEAGVKLLRSCDLRGMVPAPFVAAKALWGAKRG